MGMEPSPIAADADGQLQSSTLDSGQLLIATLMDQARKPAQAAAREMPTLQERGRSG